MKSKIPRIEFSIGNLIWDVNLIEHIIKSQKKEYKELKKYILKIYPSLKKIKKRSDIKLFLLKKYNINFKKIYKKIIYFQKKWDKINFRALKNISNILETEWNKEIITSYVSVIPISPRDWKNYTFSVDYLSNDKRFLETCVHELVHFLYLKKLREIYPKINTKTFDGVHKNWKLSEILAPILMNNPKIVKIIGQTELKSYVCDRKTTNKFWKIYQECLKKKESFEKFYKKCEKIRI